MPRRSNDRDERWGLWELLTRYPGLSVRPSKEGVVIAGDLEFRAETPQGAVEDVFEIEIRVASDFPRSIPDAYELGKRIPEDFHKHTEGSLCLGSPFSLRRLLNHSPKLLAFVERAVIPYLAGYAVFAKSGQLPFGELDHGVPGLLGEYKGILGLNDDKACVALLKLASLKKRIANKRTCPCGSGRRLGRCHHRAVNRLRHLGTRSWFAGEALYFGEILRRRAA